MLWCSIAFAKLLSPIFGDSVFNPGGDHGLYCAQWIENIIGSPGLMALLVIIAIGYLSFVSTQTVMVVRNILNPKRFIDKVKFTITNKDYQLAAAKADGRTITVEDDPEVFDDPEPQEVNFTDDGVIVNDPYSSDNAGKRTRKKKETVVNEEKKK